MIKPVTMYMVFCDRCGKYFQNDNGVCAYPDSDIEVEALESEWREINGKHYCPDCYEYDDEADDYVPRRKEDNQ